MWFTPIPVRAAVAPAAGVWLAATRVALTAPRLVGPKVTVTVQDAPGLRLVPVQVSLPVVKAAEPVTVTVSGPVLARPAWLARVKVCAAASPAGTSPKSCEEG